KGGRRLSLVADVLHHEDVVVDPLRSRHANARVFHPDEVLVLLLRPRPEGGTDRALHLLEARVPVDVHGDVAEGRVRDAVDVPGPHPHTDSSLSRGTTTKGSPRCREGSNRPTRAWRPKRWGDADHGRCGGHDDDRKNEKASAIEPPTNREPFDEFMGLLDTDRDRGEIIAPVGRGTPLHGQLEPRMTIDPFWTGPDFAAGLEDVDRF